MSAYGEIVSVRIHNYNCTLDDGIYSKVINYMFRPKMTIFMLSQLQFCSKSVIYMSILHSDVEISSHYVLQVNLSSGMSSGSMNGGVWISLVGYLWGAVI